MEIQAPKRRREKNDDDDHGSGSDRISELPDPLLLHILSFLPLKKAVQACVLSKSWSHLGPTRPVIELHGVCAFRHGRRNKSFCDHCFNGITETLLSALDKTLRRYHRQNIFTRELRLQMLEVDSELTSVLEKWIPVFLKPDTSTVTTFCLSFDVNQPYFDLPSVVFRAKSLRQLCLHGCRLNVINSIDDNVVLLKNLRKLFLSRVDVDDEALERIMAGCPLVEYVNINDCDGLKTINIIGNKNRHLRRFEFSSYGENAEHYIKTDVPTLQRIRIMRCKNWCQDRNNYFPHLKSLHLLDVKLSAESFRIFSCNFPCLEELILFWCYGFAEINLSSHSINNLNIQSTRSIEKVVVDAPNILYFEFSSCRFTSLSLTTTSREWKSHLDLYDCMEDYDDVSLWLRKLIEMVKALSQSQISLTLSETLFFSIKQIERGFNDHPVAVEHLRLNFSKLCPDSLLNLLNALFCIFRPRYTNAVRVFRNDDGH